MPARRGKGGGPWGRTRKPHAKATRQRAAIFVVRAAFTAGFRLRAGGGCLDVLAPPGMARDRSAYIRDAIREHKDEVLEFLLFLDDEAERGIIWSPPNRGTAQ